MEKWWKKLLVSSWRMVVLQCSTLCGKIEVKAKMRVLSSNMEVVQPRKSRCAHQNRGSPANMKLAAHVVKLWSWGTFFNNNNHINKPWGGLQYTIWKPAESMAINVEELSCSKLVIFHCDVSYRSVYSTRSHEIVKRFTHKDWHFTCTDCELDPHHAGCWSGFQYWN